MPPTVAFLSLHRCRHPRGKHHLPGCIPRCVDGPFAGGPWSLISRDFPDGLTWNTSVVIERREATERVLAHYSHFSGRWCVSEAVSVERLIGRWVQGRGCSPVGQSYSFRAGYPADGCLCLEIPLENS